MSLLGGFYLVDLFPSSRLVRWLSNGERKMERSYGRMQTLIDDIIEGRKAAKAAGSLAFSANDDDLLNVLLRLQEEDSLPFPLTTKTIGPVLFVSTQKFLELPQRPQGDFWSGLCLSSSVILKLWLRHSLRSVRC